MAEKVVGGARGVAGCSYMAPELRIERERSKLALEELTCFMEGEAYTKMKRDMREFSVTYILMQHTVYYSHRSQQEACIII